MQFTRSNENQCSRLATCQQWYNLSIGVEWQSEPAIAHLRNLAYRSVQGTLDEANEMLIEHKK